MFHPQTKDAKNVVNMNTFQFLLKNTPRCANGAPSPFWVSEAEIVVNISDSWNQGAVARVWRIFRLNFAPFSAAVTKSESGPPKWRCGSKTAPTLAGTGLQFGGIRYTGRLALPECAVACKWGLISPELASKLEKYAMLAAWHSQSAT